MCGIGGQVRFDGYDVETELLDKMSMLLEHRGRDDYGHFVQENVGLLHRRLSIIDLSDAAKQPMLTQDCNYGIVFNGEIFNYIELREVLKKRGVTFETSSDTEVLLKGYVEFGIDVVNMIDGMFAFCIYDKIKNKLYLVRDRLGIKPLYYHQNDRALTFASEIKAIIKSGICPFRIDPIGLKQYIHLQLYLNDQTLFKDVHALQPGHMLILDLHDNSIMKTMYWDLPEHEEEILYSEAIRELQVRLTDAVRLWSRSDVPVAAYVSGGLDSSSVAAMAIKSVKSKLMTFSSVFSSPKFHDERLFSDAVANYIGSDHHRIELNKEDIIKAHNDLLYVLDMPIAGYSAPYRVLSRIVRSSAKVVLTGHGGDELFCGYPKYIGAAIAHEMSGLVSGTTINSIQFSNLKYIKGFEQQVRQIIGRSAFGSDLEIIKSLFYRYDEIWNEVNPDIRKEADGYDVAESMLEMINYRNTGFMKKLLYLDLKILLPGLLHVEDRTSMVENLESRTPLLARSVVEFAASVPERYLFQDGLKGLIRKSVEPILPGIVTSNPSKSGTMYPAADLFENDMVDLLQSDLRLLDNYGVFVKPVNYMLGSSNQIINKRLTWGMWSIAAWLRAYA